jgi:hypothetical protein
MAEQTRTEELKVSGAALKSKLKELVRQGNVRRIVVRNPEGRTILDVPIAAGLVGAWLLPLWATIGSVVALAASYTIVIERAE